MILSQQTKGVIDFHFRDWLLFSDIFSVLFVKLMTQVEDIVQMKQQFPLKARWTWGLRAVCNTE